MIILASRYTCIVELFYSSYILDEYKVGTLRSELKESRVELKNEVGSQTLC